MERYGILRESKQCLNGTRGRVTKINRTSFVLNLHMDAIHPNNASLTFVYYAYQGNQFNKILPDINFGPLCEHFRDKSMIYNDLVKCSNLPERSQHMCPMESKVYKIENFVVDFRKLPKIPFHPSKLKVDFIIWCDGKEEIFSEFYFVDEY